MTLLRAAWCPSLVLRPRASAGARESTSLRAPAHLTRAKASKVPGVLPPGTLDISPLLCSLSCECIETAICKLRELMNAPKRASATSGGLMHDHAPLLAGSVHSQVHRTGHLQVRPVYVRTETSIHKFGGLMYAPKRRFTSSGDLCTSQRPENAYRNSRPIDLPWKISTP